LTLVQRIKGYNKNRQWTFVHYYKNNNKQAIKDTREYKFRYTFNLKKIITYINIIKKKNKVLENKYVINDWVDNSRLSDEENNNIVVTGIFGLSPSLKYRFRLKKEIIFNYLIGINSKITNFGLKNKK